MGYVHLGSKQVKLWCGGGMRLDKDKSTNNIGYNGASHFAKTIEQIKLKNPKCKIEVLIPV